VLALLIARHGADAGISYDESAQRQYGDLILAWFRSGFADDRATTFRNLYLYGGLFDAPVQWLVQFSPYGVYETRHVLTAIVALLGVVATWQLAVPVAGTRAGFLAALVLALTPAWIGHGLFNPKDIPFGTAVAFASVAALRLAIGPVPLRVRDMVWAGVTVGIALGLRPGGSFVIVYPCLAAGLRLGFEALRRRARREPAGLRPLAVQFAGCALLVLAIAWPIMLLCWPWAQLAPLSRPFVAMEAAHHFRWPASVLFEGRMVPAEDLPLSYLPVWFALTLPETYLLGAVAIGALCARLALRRPRADARRALGWTLLASVVALPFAALLATRPVLYDAQRHVLFLLPPAAAIVGCAVSELVGAAGLSRAARAAFAGAFAALAMLVAVDIVELHPFEYTYFNRLSGGLAGQYRRMETDYWSIGYREGLEYVLKELPPYRAGGPTRVVACDGVGNERLEYYLSRWPGAAARVRVVQSLDEADVLIAVRRWDCYRRGTATLGTIRRQNAPLVYIRSLGHGSGRGRT
jgi:hypothetical protein